MPACLPACLSASQLATPDPPHPSCPPRLPVRVQVGLWLAMEDATQENGCLWALPGSHEPGVYRRFLRAPDGSVGFDEGRGWVGAAPAGADLPPFDEETFVPVEVGGPADAAAFWWCQQQACCSCAATVSLVGACFPCGRLYTC